MTCKIRNNIYESTFLELADLYDTDYTAFATLTKDKQDLLVGDMIPQWNSGVQQMADAFAGEDGFYGVCKDAFEKLDNATKDSSFLETTPPFSIKLASTLTSPISFTTTAIL